MDISNFSDCWLLSLPFFFSFTRSQSLAHSLTQPFTQSFNQSFTQSLTHSLTHHSLSFLSFLSTQTLLSSIFTHTCTLFLLSPLPFFISCLHNNHSLVHSSSLHVLHLHNRTTGDRK